MHARNSCRSSFPRSLKFSIEIPKDTFISCAWFQMGSCLDDDSSSSSEGEIDPDVERVRGLRFRRQQIRKLKAEQAQTAEVLRNFREREAARRAAANENAKLRARASINSEHSGSTYSRKNSTYCGNPEDELSCRDANTAGVDVPVWLEHEKRWSLLEGSMGDAVSCSSIGMKSSRDQRLQHEEQQQLDIMENNSSLLWPPQESGILKGMASAAIKSSAKYHYDDVFLLKAVYKKASLRWHPDKFQNRFASLLASDCSRIADGTSTDILERVKRISQQINKEWGELRPQ